MKKRLRNKAFFRKGIRCAYAQNEHYSVDYGMPYTTEVTYCFCRDSYCVGYCKKYKPKTREHDYKID